MLRPLFALWLIFVVSAAATPATADVETGRAVYNYHCYFCHGFSGDARTLAATMLSPPPRDFTALEPGLWDPARMRESVRRGRPGTAMPAFGERLDESEIDAVIAFVGATFVGGGAGNILYHSPENGWSSTQFDSPAAAFVTGEVDLATADDELTEAQRDGKRIYLGSCISCHDSVAAPPRPVTWQSRAVSYPRGHYSHRDGDSLTGATPYSRHDQVPEVGPLTDRQRAGQRLFQANCAFCHAADGSGENWIGSFLEPKPRNLGGAAVRAMDDAQLARRIAEGLPGTSMPAWKHVLGDDEIRAVVAYIRVAFGGPSTGAADDSRN